MALIEVKVPDIGDFKDVAVIEVFVKSGDAIKVEQSLITVESDKASMEIPSSHAGVLKELKVKLGDKINIGDLLAILDGVDDSEIKFNQSTIGITTKKALETASSRIVVRMIKKNIFKN